MLGALAVLLCFALLVQRAFHLGLRASNGFEQLLAIGIGVMIGLQTLVITAGTLKLMPLTGVTLPLVSYGGSSLVTSYVMMGLLLFIGQRANREVTTHWLSGVGYNPTLVMKPYLRLAYSLLIGFLIVAGGLIFWQIALAPFLVARDDNPRPIVAEQTVRRGRIFTADGIPSGRNNHQ